MEPNAAEAAVEALDLCSSTRTAEWPGLVLLGQLCGTQTYSTEQNQRFIMAAGAEVHDADEVQISVKFVTKLGAEFRVPETPIVSADTTCSPGAAMHAVTHADLPVHRPAAVPASQPHSLWPLPDH
jgi:hypothetical protein